MAMQNENGEVRPIVRRLTVVPLLRRCFLAIALLMTFRTFQFFPGMPNVQEAWFVFCFLTVIFVYPFWKLRMGLRFSWFEVYLFLLMFADVLIAAWQAHRVFGQPFVYGILAQRDMSLIAMLLIFLNALRAGMIELADIEAALLFLAWATAILYSAMRLFLDPANYADSTVGFVTLPMVGVEPRFKLQAFFLIFGAFYYALRGMRTKRAKYYLAAAALFIVAGAGLERGFTVCIAVVLLFLVYRLHGVRRALIAAAEFSCIAVVLTAAIYVVSPATVSTRLTSFSDAFAVVLTGSPTTPDVSANARVFETLRALPYIQEHPLFGNGVISHPWQLENGSVLGQNFYADDIGIVGVVFSYGIVGLFLFLFQYRFAWSAAKKLPDYFHSPLLDATKAFLLFTALFSVQSGTFVWTAEVTLFFVAILVGTASQKPLLQPSGIGIKTPCDLQRPALSS